MKNTTQSAIAPLTYGRVRSIDARMDDGRAICTLVRMSYEYNRTLTDDVTLEKIHNLYEEFCWNVVEVFRN